MKQTGGFEITALECFLLDFENADWNLEFYYKNPCYEDVRSLDSHQINPISFARGLS